MIRAHKNVSELYLGCMHGFSQGVCSNADGEKLQLDVKCQILYVFITISSWFGVSQINHFY